MDRVFPIFLDQIRNLARTPMSRGGQLKGGGDCVGIAALALLLDLVAAGARGLARGPVSLLLLTTGNEGKREQKSWERRLLTSPPSPVCKHPFCGMWRPSAPPPPRSLRKLENDGKWTNCGMRQPSAPPPPPSCGACKWGVLAQES